MTKLEQELSKLEDDALRGVLYTVFAELTKRYAVEDPEREVIAGKLLGLWVGVIARDLGFARVRRVLRLLANDEETWSVLGKNNIAKGGTS